VVVAYDERCGGRLWSGGPCSTQTVIVNGVRYSADEGELDAYDLTSGAAARRPNPAKVRHPNRRLHTHRYRGR
jgi:hypothetical protein